MGQIGQIGQRGQMGLISRLGGKIEGEGEGK